MVHRIETHGWVNENSVQKPFGVATERQQGNAFAAESEVEIEGRVECDHVSVDDACICRS